MSTFKMTAERIDNTNPSFPDADAWKVRIINPRGNRFTTKFYMGVGHKGAEPKLADVLGSLIADAECVEGRSLEEFAEDLGYEIDSIKAAKQCEKTYNACLKIAERLESFLTEDEREEYRDK
jgi:hypothetical protein